MGGFKDRLRRAGEEELGVSSRGIQGFYSIKDTCNPPFSGTKSMRRRRRAEYTGLQKSTSSRQATRRLLMKLALPLTSWSTTWRAPAPMPPKHQ